jgi:multidrug efflux pump subunit AcrA (membrane-fusion protein)
MMSGMKFIRRNGIKALLVLVGISVMGIVAQRYLAASPSEPTKVDFRPGVEVDHPRRAALVQRLETNATLEAFEDTDLFAKVSGYLSDVRVDIGDHVKAGQVLAVISVPEMEDELAEDEAQLDSKQRSLETAQRQIEHNKANVALQDVTLKRQEVLFTSRNIAPQDLDVARANADIAKADVGVAEANLSFAAAQVKLAAATVERVKTLINYEQIVAPFDGVVARRLVNRGDLVQAATSTRTTPLFTVQRIETIRVFCDVPENDVPQLHIGDPAIVKPYGLERKPFVGTVTRFSFSLDPATRNMRTEIDLPNPEERLYPGMYAEVSLEMNRHPDALTVPAAAVGTDSTGTFVYTVTDNHIARLAIKIGLTDNGRTEVTGGLSKDTPVVTTFRGAPPPGTAVRPATVHHNS